MSYGTFAYGNKDFTYAKATVAIEELLQSVIEAYEVEAVFLEDIQLRQNVDSFKKLAMLQGVLVASFERREYLYGFVAPSKWQQYCNARGRTAKEIKAAAERAEADGDGKKKSKSLSIQFVREKFGIETDNDNLSDALCMGWYICNEITLEKAGGSDNGKT